MLDLHRLAREVAALPAKRPGEYATPFYTVYSHLIRAKSPAFQRRLMTLLNHGATLDAASMLFESAFPDLTYQVTIGRPAAFAVVFDGSYRQVSGPHVGADGGLALLLALVRVAAEREQAQAVRHAG